MKPVNSAIRYLALAEKLQEEIQRLPPNTILATEEETAKRFDVSRVTVRRALDMLEAAGLVTRRRGRGTAVSPPKVTRNIVPIITLDEDMKRQGVPLGTDLLSYAAAIIPPEWVREKLQLNSATKVGYLALLRHVGGRPICYEQRYFPPAIAKRFKPSKLLTEPVLKVLTKLVGETEITYNWRLDIQPASRNVAANLKIVPGVLVVAGVSVESAKGVPVQCNYTSYRVDHVQFVMNGLWTSNKSA
jgi:GntR family transcriptional regulator